MIPAGTGFRTFQESEVRIRPEALASLAAEKDRALVDSFPLLEAEGGPDNGSTLDTPNEAATAMSPPDLGPSEFTSGFGSPAEEAAPSNEPAQGSSDALDQLFGTGGTIDESPEEPQDPPV